MRRRRMETNEQTEKKKKKKKKKKTKKTRMTMKGQGEQKQASLEHPTSAGLLLPRQRPQALLLITH